MDLSNYCSEVAQNILSVAIAEMRRRDEGSLTSKQVKALITQELESIIKLDFVVADYGSVIMLVKDEFYSIAKSNSILTVNETGAIYLNPKDPFVNYDSRSTELRRSLGELKTAMDMRRLKAGRES